MKSEEAEGEEAMGEPPILLHALITSSQAEETITPKRKKVKKEKVEDSGGELCQL